MQKNFLIKKGETGLLSKGIENVIDVSLPQAHLSSFHMFWSMLAEQPPSPPHRTLGPTSRDVAWRDGLRSWLSWVRKSASFWLFIQLWLGRTETQALGVVVGRLVVMGVR